MKSDRTESPFGLLQASFQKSLGGHSEGPGDWRLLNEKQTPRVFELLHICIFPIWPLSDSNYPEFWPNNTHIKDYRREHFSVTSDVPGHGQSSFANCS